MAYSRDYLFYPPEMRDALQKVFDTQQPLVFDCPSKNRAQSIRGQFYAYFRALREAAYKKDLPDREVVVDLYRIASQVTVVADEARVIIQLKSSAKEMTALREVINAGEDPAEASLAKLKEKLE